MTAYPIDTHAPSARRAGGAIALAALMLALAGCGNSDDSGQANKTDSEPSAAAAGQTENGMATGATIRKRIAGNTVAGTMAPDSAYTEFYAADGTIRGASYEAKWTIEGDRMCFDYDEAPEADCYAVKIDGNSVEWHLDGETQGKGTIVEGNPNNF
ncbi:hypothetical protein [Salinisphaera aquimarina]|uniref:Lipoprotein n=1 Tax=Salinisphaera aquimarina TaxID=2094031 RepID=A0ABV7EKM8_9GAMM